MEKKYWYAAQKDSSDEWGNGSYNRDEAIAMAKTYRDRGYADALVAVIDEDKSICVDEIHDLED